MGLDLLDGGKIRFFTTGALTASKIDMLSKVGLFIEQDPVDRNSIQFRIPSESTGTSHDRIALYISSSGFVGIGTKDPTSAFDIRDNSEDAAPSGSGKTQLFGLGTTGPIFAESITASKDISASGDIIATGDVIARSGSFDVISKVGDPNTSILFTDDDINITVGGINMVDFTEAGSDEITFNEGAQQLDIRIESEADANLFFTDGTNNKVGIGTNEPSKKLTVAGDISASGDVYAKLNDNTGFMLGTLNALSGDASNVLYLGNNNTWAQIKYGRQNSDQHTFVGDITSSGNISASFGKTIFASSASLDVLTGTSGEDGLDVTGFVSASTAVASPTGSFNVFTKFPHIIYAGSNHYNGLGRYIAWNDPSEQNTPSSLGPEYTEFIFPRSGSLRDFHMKFETETTSTTEVRFYIVPNGTDYATAGASNAQEVVELPAVAAHTHQGHAVSASFAPGDRLTVYVDPGHSSATAVNFTMVMEYDMTSYNLYS